MVHRVYLVGVGMGNPRTLTFEAREAIEGADLLIGSERLLEPWQGAGKRCLALVKSDEIAQAVRSAREKTACVLVSGDAGFYSGGTGLRAKLSDYKLHTIPGVSSVQYFCAKLGRPWQDVCLVSAHGRAHNAVGEIRANRLVFVLVGGATRVQDICCELVDCGLGAVRVWAGERLSYDDERIVQGTAEQLSAAQLADLAVMLVENPQPVSRPFGAPSLADDEFVRGNVPMTKEEVRALAVAKLRIPRAGCVWDVGAGTGSVSVECALAAPAGLVCAVERDAEALALLRQNKERFGCTNLQVVEGQAPDALAGLPRPDCVFVGGAGGHLFGVLQAAFAANPAVRVVVAAITIETLSAAVRAASKLGAEGLDVVQVQASRARQAGKSHLMCAQNPVCLVAFSGAGK